MLTADLALNRVRGDRVEPRYIDPANSAYLKVSGDLIKIVSEHRGRKRAELDRALGEFVGAGTNYKVMRGLIKLLTDECRFETASPVPPEEIRRAVFLKARSRHPLVGLEDARALVLAEAAAELGCAPEEVIANLYSDLWNNQVLVEFDEVTAPALIDRYNVAQAQALLYRCLGIGLRVEPQEAARYRRLFDAIKAYRLIHTIHGNPASGYTVKLDGPVSIFHQSQKYGIQMAVFLPALLLCSGWSLKAEIALKGDARAWFELTSDQRRLRSHYLDDISYRPAIEERFTALWAKGRADWRLEPNRQVIDLGETAFVPDFVIERPDGRRFYLEALGFWTPRYLDERVRDFERAGFRDYLLAVTDELRGSRDEASGLPPNVILYKSSLNPAAVQIALEAL
ncbi:MAG TPA: DUF790 family protein [Blastocatellia bacterium]|nr:DUF790 family protein [Blastocatellia bacterium]